MPHLTAALAGVASSARAEAPTKRAVTEEVARVLAQAFPLHRVTIARDLQLSIRHSDGTETPLSLASLYSDYTHDPAQLDAIVETYVAALSRREAPRTKPGKPGRTRIVPLIKNRRWLLENNRALKMGGTSQEILSEDLNDELVVAYAEDRNGTTRYLMSTEDVGDRDALRALALSNLRRMLPKVEVQHHGHFAIIAAGGDYEASLLLFDDIWSGEQIKFDGDLVVAVPAKDIILISGSRNRAGLQAVRKMAADLVAQERDALTDVLFVYRNGRFTKFSPK